MKNNYFAFAALAGLLSLTACSGKPANEQAAEDAQKVNAAALIPQISAALADECARGGINLACPAEKAKAFIKTYPPFKAIIADYDKQCPQNYGAKLCAQGYAAYLADNVADRLAGSVSARAKDSLTARAETMRRAAAAKAAAEEAARKAKAAAEEAARKAAEAAKAAEEKMKNEAEDLAKKAANAVKPAETHTAAPKPAAPAAGQ